jgi:hypothetical protein
VTTDPETSNPAIEAITDSGEESSLTPAAPETKTGHKGDHRLRAGIE